MTAHVDQVHELRTQLEGLPCPACGTHDLRPILQCDYYPDGCLWLARCESCGAQYHIDPRSVPT